jgi:hypothetical protein
MERVSLKKKASALEVLRSGEPASPNPMSPTLSDEVSVKGT